MDTRNGCPEMRIGVRMFESSITNRLTLERYRGIGNTITRLSACQADATSCLREGDLSSSRRPEGGRLGEK